MARAKVIVCAIVRDAADELPGFVARIDRLASRVADLRVILYENDSADRTPRMLAEWAEAEPRVEVVSERRDDPPRREGRARARTEQVAGYRNRCRDLAVERYGEFDFVLVPDFGVEGWSEAGIANTFGHEGWDAVGANGLSIRVGRPVYYDAWAFRAVGHAEAHRNRSVNLMVFPTGAPLVRVDSCFGGLAVYRMAAMRAARYGGEDCEHVVLHRGMRAAGFGQFFLNPSMLVRYPDQEKLTPGLREHPRWWERKDPSERPGGAPD